jgi:cytochrome c553
MRQYLFAVLLVVLLLVILGGRRADAGEVPPSAPPSQPPSWAYVVNPPDFKLSPDDGKPRRVPDSDLTYFVPQTRDRFLAPDWHPDEHPPLPEIVGRGRKPAVYACGFCHRADGPGGPENAAIAGLPARYIVQQMADFKSGRRGTSVAGRVPPDLMLAVAMSVSDDDLKEAAAYFAALKPRATIKVIESETVPKTVVAGWFLADARTGEREPIGDRIIEIPDDLAQFENRDSHSHFIAYVPPGSVETGKHLATDGDGKSVACASCHGVGLKGTEEIPAIAGRSPSYLMRQMYDIGHGARAGAGSEPMKAVLEKLTTADMLALAAYVATLSP